MSDVAQAYRSHPERTEEAVHKVRAGGLGNAGPGATITAHGLLPLQLQSCLTRNQLRQTLPAQTFRLQQGILTTSSEQVGWTNYCVELFLPCPKRPWLAHVSSCKQQNTLLTFPGWKAEQIGGMEQVAQRNCACQVSRSVQAQAGLKGLPDNDRGVGTRGLLRSLPTQTIS